MTDDIQKPSKKDVYKILSADPDVIIFRPWVNYFRGLENLPIFEKGTEHRNYLIVPWIYDMCKKYKHKFEEEEYS